MALLLKSKALLQYFNPIRSASTAVADSFRLHFITQDLELDAPPIGLLEVSYENNLKVNLGNALTPADTKYKPIVKFPCQKNSLYTLSFIDMDAPSRNNPKYRGWDHWLVVNVPGADITHGQEISTYIGAAPKVATGYHRFVFLLFRQPDAIENIRQNPNPKRRKNFNISKFLRKYNMTGAPTAANFFYAKWDPYVNILHKKLGLIK